MKNFPDWYIELIEDERFYENASRNHRKETVEETARKVYEMESLNPAVFAVTPMSEHRKHLLNKLYKITPDKVKKNWVTESIKKQEEEQKAKEKPPEPPLERGSPQYLKRTQELIDAIQATKMIKPIAPLTAKERLENTGWRPKPETIREPTEQEKLTAFENHKNLLLKARTKLFREKYPDGSPKDLQKYLNKFKDRF
jgi:hypothetical protein